MCKLNAVRNIIKHNEQYKFCTICTRDLQRQGGFHNLA